MAVLVEKSDAYGWKYSNEWVGPKKPDPLTGTIDITNGVVTGTLTVFTTELIQDQYIVADDYIFRVLSIVSDTSAVVDLPIEVLAQPFYTLEDADSEKWRSKKASLLKSEQEILACIPNLLTDYQISGEDAITLYAIRLYEGYKPRKDNTLKRDKLGDFEQEYNQLRSCLERFPTEVQAILNPFLGKTYGGVLTRDDPCQA